jgi:hypothetical protein
MASEVFDLPRASDGAGYDDHDNADRSCYYNSGGKGNEAGCEARRHCQNFQSTGKVLEMQVWLVINICYERGSWAGVLLIRKNKPALFYLYVFTVDLRTACFGCDSIGGRHF